MAVPDPIVVLTCGRSGSSLVTNLIVAHGAWCGDVVPANEWNKGGFYENSSLWGTLRKHWGADWFNVGDQIIPIDLEERFKEILTEQGYKSGPWVMKHGAVYHHVWEATSWTPTFIKVKRPIDAICQSYQRCGFLENKYPPEKIRELMELQLNLMDSVDGFTVNTDKMVAGDYTEIKAAIEGSGLDYNENKIKDIINPAWYKTSPQITT